MDFAPYQDQSPETTRALSPPPPDVAGRGRRSRSFSPRPNTRSPPVFQPITDPWAAPASQLPSPSHFGGGGGSGGQDLESGLGGGNSGSGRTNVDLFETSLPLRLDYEAMLAYLLLPPAGGVFLLLVEQKSDYVRFHAWQSSLLFATIFVVHLIFSWSSILSWLLFAGDLVLIAWLTLRAYRDADTLDRCEVPFFGPLASSILDDE